MDWTIINYPSDNFHIGRHDHASFVLSPGGNLSTERLFVFGGKTTTSTETLVHQDLIEIKITSNNYIECSAIDVQYDESTAAAEDDDDTAYATPRPSAAQQSSKKQAKGGKKLLNKLGSLVHHGSPRKSLKNSKQTAESSYIPLYPTARYGHQMTVQRLLRDDDPTSAASDDSIPSLHLSSYLTSSSLIEDASYYDYNVYLFGGYSYEDKVLGDLWVLQVREGGKTFSWHRIVVPEDEPYPCARSNHYIEYFDGYLYLFGGTNGHIALSDFWRFDCDAISWERVDSDAPPGARFGHAMVVLEESRKLVVMCGFSNRGLTKGFGLTPLISTQLTTTLTKVTGVKSQALQNIIYNYFDDVWVYDLDGSQAAPGDKSSSRWKLLKLKGTAPAPRYELAAVPLSYQHIAIFGGRHTTKVHRSVYILDLDSLKWNRIPNAKTGWPIERRSHSLSIVGVPGSAGKPPSKYLVIIGGKNSSNSLTEVCFVPVELAMRVGGCQPTMLASSDSLKSPRNLGGAPASPRRNSKELSRHAPVAAVQYAAKVAASEFNNIISVAQPIDRERQQYDDYMKVISKETYRITKLQDKTSDSEKEELVKALVSRSEAYRQLQLFEKAMVDAREAVKLQPENTEALVLLCHILYRVGEYLECLRYLPALIRKLEKQLSDAKDKKAHGTKDKKAKYSAELMLLHALKIRSKTLLALSKFDGAEVDTERMLELTLKLNLVTEETRKRRGSLQLNLQQLFQATKSKANDGKVPSAKLIYIFSAYKSYIRCLMALKKFDEARYLLDTVREFLIRQEDRVKTHGPFDPKNLLDVMEGLPVLSELTSRTSILLMFAKRSRHLDNLHTRIEELRQEAQQALDLAKKGDAAKASDQFYEASRFYEASIALDPANLTICSKLGECYLELRAFDDLVSLGRSVSQTNSQAYEGYLIMAQGKAGLREFDDAEEVLETGLEAVEGESYGDDELRDELRYLKKRRENVEAAVYHAKLARENRPRQELYQDSLKAYNEALRLDPDNRDYLLERLDLFLAMKRIDDADEDSVSVCKYHPSSLAAYLARARVLEEKQHFSNAVIVLMGAFESVRLDDQRDAEKLRSELTRMKDLVYKHSRATMLCSLAAELLDELTFDDKLPSSGDLTIRYSSSGLESSKDARKVEALKMLTESIELVPVVDALLLRSRLAYVIGSVLKAAKDAKDAREHILSTSDQKFEATLLEAKSFACLTYYDVAIAAIKLGGTGVSTSYQQDLQKLKSHIEAMQSQLSKFEKYHAEALKLYDQKKYAKAMPEYEKLLANKAGDKKEQSQAYPAVGSRTLLSCYVESAESHFQSGKLEESLRDCDAALSISGDLPLIFALKVRSLYALGFVEEALLLCEQTLRSCPHNPVLNGLWVKIRTRVVDKQSDSLFQEGSKALESSMFEKAHASLTQSIGLKPTARKFMLRAETRLKLGYIQSAINDLNDAIEKARLFGAPATERSYYMVRLAQVELEKAGDVLRAKEAASRAIEADPNNKQAKEIMKKIMDSEQEFRDAYYLNDEATQLLESAGSDEKLLEKALNNLQQASLRYPKNTAYIIDSSRVLFKLRRFTEAIAAADSAIAQDAACLPALLERTRGLIELRRLDEARDTIKKAQKIDRDNKELEDLEEYLSDFKATLEEADEKYDYAQDEDTDKDDAIKLLRQCVSADPVSIKYSTALIEAIVEEDRDEAEYRLEYALQLHPTSSELRLFAAKMYTEKLNNSYEGLMHAVAGLENDYSFAGGIWDIILSLLESDELDEYGVSEKTDIAELLDDEVLDKTSLIDYFVMKPGKTPEGDQANLSEYLNEDDLKDLDLDIGDESDQPTPSSAATAPKKEYAPSPTHVGAAAPTAYYQPALISYLSSAIRSALTDVASVALQLLTAQKRDAVKWALSALSLNSKYPESDVVSQVIARMGLEDKPSVDKGMVATIAAKRRAWAEKGEHPLLSQASFPSPVLFEAWKKFEVSSIKTSSVDSSSVTDMHCTKELTFIAHLANYLLVYGGALEEELAGSDLLDFVLDTAQASGLGRVCGSIVLLDKIAAHVIDERQSQISGKLYHALAVTIKEVMKRAKTLSTSAVDKKLSRPWLTTSEREMLEPILLKIKSFCEHIIQRHIRCAEENQQRLVRILIKSVALVRVLQLAVAIKEESIYRLTESSFIENLKCSLYLGIDMIHVLLQKAISKNQQAGSSVSELLALTEAFGKYLDEHYVPAFEGIFPRVVNYVKTAVERVRDLVQEDLERELHRDKIPVGHADDPVDSAIFQLPLVLPEFTQYLCEHCPVEPFSVLPLVLPYAYRWVALNERYLKKWIDNAMQVDTFQPLPGSKYSSVVVDTMTAINESIEFIRDTFSGMLANAKAIHESVDLLWITFCSVMQSVMCYFFDKMDEQFNLCLPIIRIKKLEENTEAAPASATPSSPAKKATPSKKKAAPKLPADAFNRLCVSMNNVLQVSDRLDIMEDIYDAITRDEIRSYIEDEQAQLRRDCKNTLLGMVQQVQSCMAENTDCLLKDIVEKLGAESEDAYQKLYELFDDKLVKFVYLLDKRIFLPLISTLFEHISLFVKERIIPAHGKAFLSKDYLEDMKEDLQSFERYFTAGGEGLDKKVVDTTFGMLNDLMGFVMEDTVSLISEYKKLKERAYTESNVAKQAAAVTTPIDSDSEGEEDDEDEKPATRATSKPELLQSFVSTSAKWNSGVKSLYVFAILYRRGYTSDAMAKTYVDAELAALKFKKEQDAAQRKVNETGIAELKKTHAALDSEIKTMDNECNLIAARNRVLRKIKHTCFDRSTARVSIKTLRYQIVEGSRDSELNQHYIEAFEKLAKSESGVVRELLMSSSPAYVDKKQLEKIVLGKDATSLVSKDPSTYYKLVQSFRCLYKMREGWLCLIKTMPSGGNLVWLANNDPNARAFQLSDTMYRGNSERYTMFLQFTPEYIMYIKSSKFLYLQEDSITITVQRQKDAGKKQKSKDGKTDSNTHTKDLVFMFFDNRENAFDAITDFIDEFVSSSESSPIGIGAAKILVAAEKGVKTAAKGAMHEIKNLPTNVAHFGVNVAKAGVNVAKTSAKIATSAPVKGASRIKKYVHRRTRSKTDEKDLALPAPSTAYPVVRDELAEDQVALPADSVRSYPLSDSLRRKLSIQDPDVRLVGQFDVDETALRLPGTLFLLSDGSVAFAPNSAASSSVTSITGPVVFLFAGIAKLGKVKQNAVPSGGSASQGQASKHASAALPHSTSISSAISAYQQFAKNAIKVQETSGKTLMLSFATAQLRDDCYTLALACIRDVIAKQQASLKSNDKTSRNRQRIQTEILVRNDTILLKHRAIFSHTQQVANLVDPSQAAKQVKKMNVMLQTSVSKALGGAVNAASAAEKKVEAMLKYG